MTTYEVFKNSLGQEIIKATDSQSVVFWIPADPANSDYQRYLNPEAEQSTPSVTNGD
jgi:hypothetical protein